MLTCVLHSRLEMTIIDIEMTFDAVLNLHTNAVPGVIHRRGHFTHSWLSTIFSAGAKHKFGAVPAKPLI